MIDCSISSECFFTLSPIVISLDFNLIKKKIEKVEKIKTTEINNNGLKIANGINIIIIKKISLYKSLYPKIKFVTLLDSLIISFVIKDKLVDYSSRFATHKDRIYEDLVRFFGNLKAEGLAMKTAEVHKRPMST